MLNFAKSKTPQMIDTFHLHVANFCIEVNCTEIEEVEVKKNFILNLYQHYAPYIFIHCKRKPDFHLRFVAEWNISLERRKKDDHSEYMMHLFSLKKKNEIETFYHISISHMQLLLKIIIQKLLMKTKGFFLHSSSVFDPTHERLYVFTGPNCAGKSTMVSRIKDVFTPYSDDVLIVKYERRKWVGYQMPLESDEELYPYRTTEAYPIHSLALIHKSKKIEVKQLSKNDIDIGDLMRQIVGGAIYPQNIQSFFSFIDKIPELNSIYFPKTIKGRQIQKYLQKNVY